LLEPLTDFDQAVFLLGGKLAIPLRSPGEKEVAIAGGIRDEHLDELVAGLWLAAAVAPAVRKANAGLPRAPVLEKTEALFGRIEVTRQGGAVV